jgi:hypothetical protein
MRPATAQDTGRYEIPGEHWWRAAFIVAALAVAVFVTDEPWIAQVGAIPKVLGCTRPVRSQRNGVAVGLILFALLVWFMAARRLGWAGRWVPSLDEAIWLHTVLATLVYGFSSPAKRRVSGFLPLVLMLPLCLLLVGWVVMERTESGSPPDEGVDLVPAGLEVVGEDRECGSGGCDQIFELAGADAADVMRAHLADQGLTTTPGGQTCRLTGVVVPLETCVSVQDTTTGTVRVSVYVE